MKNPYIEALKRLPGAQRPWIALQATFLRAAVELSPCMLRFSPDQATSKQVREQLRKLANALEALDLAIDGLSWPAQSAVMNARERDGVDWPLQHPAAIRLLLIESFPNAVEIIRQAERDVASGTGPKRSRGMRPNERALAIAQACGSAYLSITGRRPTVTNPSDASKDPDNRGSFVPLVATIFKLAGLRASPVTYATKIQDSMRNAELHAFALDENL